MVPADDLAGHISHLVGFVPQDDVMHKNLTVKENLKFYSRLRDHDIRTMNTTKQQKELVEGVMRILEIGHVRHSLIGDEYTRGISGGQRKRVNVAIEIMGKPSVLFLDEPTSGLDSTSTEALVKNLKALAQSGLTVVMVIHQPRYEAWQLIDDIILLNKGGTAAYVGSVAGAPQYFSALGYECPQYANPADFYLDVISELPKVIPATDSSDSGPHGERVSMNRAWDMYMESGLQWHLDQGSDPLRQQPLSSLPVSSMPSTYRQTFTCFQRSLRQQQHETGILILDLALLLGFGLLIGFTAQGGACIEQYCPTTFLLGAMVIGLTAAVSGLKVFGAELIVFKREARSGTSTTAYFCGKLLAQTARTLLHPAMFMLLFYASSFPACTTTQVYKIFLATQISGALLGVLVSLVASPQNSQIVAVLLSLAGVLFAGNMPTITQLNELGFFGQFMQLLSYARWCVSALSAMAAASLPPVIMSGVYDELANSGSLTFSGVYLDFPKLSAAQPGNVQGLSNNVTRCVAPYFNDNACVPGDASCYALTQFSQSMDASICLKHNQLIQAGDMSVKILYYQVAVLISLAYFVLQWQSHTHRNIGMKAVVVRMRRRLEAGWERYKLIADFSREQDDSPVGEFLEETAQARYERNLEGQIDGSPRSLVLE
jgi:ABC-type multidrug transport system ATPase subunit